MGTVRADEPAARRRAASTRDAAAPARVRPAARCPRAPSSSCARARSKTSSRALADEGVQSLLLEGGPTLAEASSRRASSTSCWSSSRRSSDGRRRRSGALLAGRAVGGVSLTRLLRAPARAEQVGETHRDVRHLASPTIARAVRPAAIRLRVFTGIVASAATSSLDAGEDGIRLRVRAPERHAQACSATRSPSTASASPSSRSTNGRLAFDVVQETLSHRARKPFGERGQPRAGPACRRAARRPLRPGPRRRRRPRPVGRGRRRRRAVWLDAASALLRYLRREGLDRSRRRLADGRRARRRRLRSRARPAHARGHDARPPAAGRRVNLEVDVLAKYVERLLHARIRFRADGSAGPESRLRHRRGGDRGHPPGQVRRRRRRCRPRERGRPDDRRAVRDARGDQLHGDARRAG